MSSQKRSPPDAARSDAAAGRAPGRDRRRRRAGRARASSTTPRSEARRYLEEAQARADRIVAERLREAADELERPGDADGAEPRLRPVEAAPSRRPRPAEPEPAPAATAPRLGRGARLLATQMAVSGSSREEIEMRLRNGFEIEDTSEILDAILGPEE